MAVLLAQVLLPCCFGAVNGATARRKESRQEAQEVETFVVD